MGIVVAHVRGFTILGRHYEHFEDLAYLKMACPTPKGVTETGTLLKLSWLSATSLDLYTGTLEGDPDSRVTVCGGEGKESTVSIASNRVPGGFVDLCISSKGVTSSLSILM